DIPRSVQFLRPFSTPSLQRFNSLFRLVTAPAMKRLTSPKYAGLLEYGSTYGGAYLLRRGMFMPWELPELLDPDLVREGWDRLQSLARLEATTRDLQSPRLRVSALEMTWYMRHQLLRDTDWASMDHSLEVRTPLVDVQLLKALAPLLAGTHPPTKRDMALSVGEKVKSRSGKVESRKQKAEIGDRSISAFNFQLSALPSSVLDRKKTGFVVPVREWLVQEDVSFQHERGLRGWTRLVYSAYLGARIDSLHLTRAALRRAPGRRRAEARKEKADGGHEKIEWGNGPSTLNSQLSASSASSLRTPHSALRTPRKVLVFRIGQLGD